MASDQPLDWDAVFENPETGFIPLIMQSKSAEALKQTALLVIRKLHTRKNDEPNIEKYSAALDAIFLDIIRRDDLTSCRQPSKNCYGTSRKSGSKRLRRTCSPRDLPETATGAQPSQPRKTSRSGEPVPPNNAPA